MRIITTENYRQGRIPRNSSFPIVITAIRRAVDESKAIHGAIISGSPDQNLTQPSSDIALVLAFQGQKRPDIGLSRVRNDIKPVLALARKLNVPIDLTIFDLSNPPQHWFTVNPLERRIMTYYEGQHGSIKNPVCANVFPNDWSPSICALNYMAGMISQLRQSSLQFDWLDPVQKARFHSDILRTPLIAARLFLLAVTDDMLIAYGSSSAQLQASYQTSTKYGPAHYLYETMEMARKYNAFLKQPGPRNTEAYENILLDIRRMLDKTIDFLSENMKFLGV